jgi:hypothetical protein
LNIRERAAERGIYSAEEAGRYTRSVSHLRLRGAGERKGAFTGQLTRHQRQTLGTSEKTLHQWNQTRLREGQGCFVQLDDTGNGEVRELSEERERRERECVRLVKENVSDSVRIQVIRLKRHFHRNLEKVMRSMNPTFMTFIFFAVFSDFSQGADVTPQKAVERRVGVHLIFLLISFVVTDEQIQ